MNAIQDTKFRFESICQLQRSVDLVGGVPDYYFRMFSEKLEKNSHHLIPVIGPLSNITLMSSVNMVSVRGQDTLS